MTGPQRYPGASTADWYGAAYPGSAMDVNVVVLHTTEGRTLPAYDGGAVAPNLTAVPDLAARKLRWYQHFEIDRSSRALVNLAGGVETNTLNVCQVELVGTCDPTTHKRWGTSPHIYWPDAPDWALAEVAEFLAWMHANHGVPLSGPAKWPAYPSSYGSSAGARMSNSTWSSFTGVCGHLHVPENVHGDPGAIDFARLIALAKGGTQEEDDVAITDADAEKIARKVLTLDGVIPNPVESDNKFITLTTSARNIEIVARRSEAKLAAQSTAIAELTKTVAQLATNSEAIDPDALIARITQAIESIDVHLEASAS